MKIERRWEVLVEALTAGAIVLKPGQKIDIAGFDPLHPDVWVDTTLRIRAQNIEFLTGSKLSMFEVWIYSYPEAGLGDDSLPVELSKKDTRDLVLRSYVDLEQLPGELEASLLELESKARAKSHWFYELSAPAIAKDRIRREAGIEYEEPDWIRQRDQAAFSPSRFRRETVEIIEWEEN